MKFKKLLLALFYIWNYAKAEYKPRNNTSNSNRNGNLDNQFLIDYFELLQEKMLNIQTDLDRQMDILSNLGRKVDNLPIQLDKMEKKLMKINIQNYENLKRHINKITPNQTSVDAIPSGSNSNAITDILNKQNQILKTITGNQNEAKMLLHEISLDKDTQTLLNAILNKLAILPQIDAKLSSITQGNISSDIKSNSNNAKDHKEINLENFNNIVLDKLSILPQLHDRLSFIENNTISKDLLTDIINKQNNIRDLLHELSVNNHTQTLANSILSELAAILPQLNDKLNSIENITIQRHIPPKVLSNSNNKKDRNEINLKKYIQSLNNTISDQLAILPSMDDRLIYIKDNIIPKDIFNDLDQHIQDLKKTITNNLDILPPMDAKLDIIVNSTMSSKLLTDATDKQTHDLVTVPQLDAMLSNYTQNLICSSKSYPKSCADFDATFCTDNKCRILNRFYGPTPFLVSCNDVEGGGGWTVIQRRMDGSENFYRDWADYKVGFGKIDGEFFIGLDKLHALTSSLQPVLLLIVMRDLNDTKQYAQYDDFQVASEAENYKLVKLGSYRGTAGDSFSRHVGYNFTTRDRDNDINVEDNCAIICAGAWWYEQCFYSNLNGVYGSGLLWYTRYLKTVEMLIRPRKLMRIN